MDKLCIDILFSGTHMIAEFQNKINLLVAGSGGGKTFLMKGIEEWCLQNNISCWRFNGDTADISLDNIKCICRSHQVLLFDNASLYMTNELMDWLKKTNKYVIISAHKTSGFDTRGITEYWVTFENRQITIDEL